MRRGLAGAMRFPLVVLAAFLLVLPFVPSSAASIGSCVSTTQEAVCHGGGCVWATGAATAVTCVPLSPQCTDHIMESVYVCENDPAGCFGYSVAGWYRTLACV